MLNPLTNALVYHEFFRHSDKVGLAVATGGLRTLANDSYGDAIGLRRAWRASRPADRSGSTS